MSNSGERAGSVLAGKYELTSLLGEGGMGAVYKAQHNLINRELAVKFLHPQYADNEEVVTRFRREAQSAAKIGHENIIEITDMGTADDGAPYIVMEFLKGRDVKDLVEDEGIQSVERTVNILVQALEGLRAAHNVGIIHRDLKPENIFLVSKSSNPDYVKLLDFGISKFKELETDGAKALTQTGTVLGTPHYMSPEQAKGEQDLKPGSDIYAMGVIMYQMLTGSLPFDAPNYNALLIKILTEEAPLPEELNPDLPDDIIDIIKTAMNKNPIERFTDCDEFLARILPYSTIRNGDATSTINTMAHSTESKPRVNTVMTPMQMTQSGISPAHKKNKTPLIAAAIAAVLTVGVSLALVLSNGGKEAEKTAPAEVPMAAAAEPSAEPDVTPEEPAKEEPPDAAPNAADDNLVKVTVAAVPKEATITIDGVVVTNPYSGYKKKNEKLDHPIIVKATGYEQYSEMVVFGKDLELNYELEKKKATARRRTPRKSAKTSSSGSSGSSGNSGTSVQIQRKEEPKPATNKRPRRRIDYDDPWN